MYYPGAQHAFFERSDWGIFHAAYKKEPFGYSILQASDYGKVLILSKDYLPEFDYPFRADTRDDFEQTVRHIESSDLIWLDHVRRTLNVYLRSITPTKED